MDLEFAQNNVVAKLPILKQGEYKMWKLRIEQYFQVQDYALWDVIDNGNSFKPVPRTTTNVDGTSTSTIPGPKIVSHLAILGENISQEDLNMKFLRSLPSGTPVSTVSSHDNTANLSDVTVYAFLANQPNGSQLMHEDLEQINEDDLEEIDLKWQLALLSMRARRYIQLTGKKITINGSDTAGYDKTKVLIGATWLMMKFQPTWLLWPSQTQRTGLGFTSYNVVAPPFTGLFAHPSIDLSNSGLEEFQHPEFKGYGPKDRNISYLTDFKEHDRGYVTFRGGAKGGKITGQGIIKTEKGIKKEYSVARTPQQNRVAERRNRTLIEAVRTMLANSKLPTTFWVKAVNTACYVQNRVLVVKPHFKTPYELFKGRSPALSFMRPFGCHVTILNPVDQLRKFDGKLDKGMFIGYSTISKAFRVYNIRTRKLFDIDDLSKLMNYAPFPTDNSLFDSSSQALDSHNKDKHGPSQASESDNQERPNAKSSTKSDNADGPVNTATPTYAHYPNDPLMPDLEDARIFDDA
nr:retrovirus-related Pol polyprotein from transposon TNT 1-94 [Tanacetum cinerariifolium]